MIDRTALLADLRRRLRLLERDLAERAEEAPAMAAALDAEYRAAQAAERTGDTFRVWRSGELTQAAVAWLLGCVFVRFAEDNGLIEAPLIGGPGGRNARAVDRQTLYFRERPTDSDRDYLLDVFAEAARLPALAELYDQTRNPVWRYGISGDAARDLLAFWRAVDPDSGVLRHDFSDPEWGTRFLGDLYQDLSDDAKKRYALLQTPEFVEEFILDRTLTPALDEFGLADTRLIDPACGSGHFLLGAFHRLLRAWLDRQPGTPARVLAQRSLNGVYGVDINPFAAAIARFRLLIAALRASDIDRLKEAAAFTIHVAAGDSLLHGRRFGELDFGSGAEQLAGHRAFGHAFLAEDIDALNRILGQQYHVVVGNPPYIIVRDKALNQLYRSRYSTCHMKYALSVPFTERFWDLAFDNSVTHGYVGMITANSFMKREFGKKLIGQFLSRRDLTHIVDTSGAYIPGHGTPTVILLGRARPPVGRSVRCAIGVKGEPSTPKHPSQGKVWMAIVAQIDIAGSKSEWVSVVECERANLATHPWSLGGDDSMRLKMTIHQRSASNLQQASTSIGFMAISGDDEVFSRTRPGDFKRVGVSQSLLRLFVTGDVVRDWAISPASTCLYDYDSKGSYVGSITPPRILWPYRTSLRCGLAFGKTRDERGMSWAEFAFVVKDKLRSPRSITFAFVATHNHFALDLSGKVFNRSSPVIKLPDSATESDHLGITGALNSSVACFLMKELFHNKGSTVDTHGARQTTDAFENFYEHTCSGLKLFPLPNKQPIEHAEALDRLAVGRQAQLPRQLAIANGFPSTPAELDRHRDAAAKLLARMIALQEELDWECYLLYGVVDQDFRYLDMADHREPPPLNLGERAFEIVMARRMAAGELETAWFTRHSSTPILEPPVHWPADYRTLVERRIEMIQSDPFINLIERPEYKRRWNVEPWHYQEQRALRGWLLDRLESPAYWPEVRLATARELAERAAADTDFLQVAARYTGDAGVDVEPLVAELIENESVPALPVQLYKPSGLAKRADWQATWTIQRREDVIDAEVAATTVRQETETDQDYAARLQTEQRRRKRDELGEPAPPPRYRSADFAKPSYWRLRGPLDVPKERFVSFPHMSRANDPSLLVGWAGWDTLALCHAVAACYAEVLEKEGGLLERLTPLLAVLHENLPWLKQWHNDIDAVYHQRLGDFYETFLRSQLSTAGLTSDDLSTWEPPKTARARRRITR